MNFELSEEQTLLAETIKRFVATHYNFDARAKIMASPRGHSEDVWAAIAEMGLLGLPFAEAHGGFGGTTVDVKLVMEAIKKTVESAGMTMDDVVMIQVSCPDLSLYDTFNKVYRTYFHGEFPARAFLGSGKLLRDAHFEVLGVAVKKSK